MNWLKNLNTILEKGNIGKFGDGRKKIDKKITICIGDSLCNVTPGSPGMEVFF
jgi:hypothetical protein